MTKQQERVPRAMMEGCIRILQQATAETLGNEAVPKMNWSKGSLERAIVEGYAKEMWAVARGKWNGISEPRNGSGEGVIEPS